MKPPQGLTALDKLFLLPVGLILAGSAVWNWAHGWRDAFTLVWLLVGVNNLLLLGQKAWPRRRCLFGTLIPLSGIALILASAYLLFSYLNR